MSIRTIITEINRQIGNKEIIENTRINGSRVRNSDLLTGIYVSEDEYIEIVGASGMEINIKIDNNLNHEKLGLETYRIYNRNINVLIRPLNSENI
ncbi:hypothetical protein UMC2_15771 [[Clostridium] sordellii]|uniref:hypothetical protein n=1 Tax=Paraclostridium sordellii TaxID=1505 RepID=UPI000542510B|nr:hypothetical protein [Paeniclostridium sordellii]CEK34621.1 hypothetical protein UMC2_15771 [[Clostridium] sordellii] [Paeniclostridium sordellii]